MLKSAESIDEHIHPRNGRRGCVKDVRPTNEEPRAAEIPCPAAIFSSDVSSDAYCDFGGPVVLCVVVVV
jgi:hypothetical protein